MFRRMEGWFMDHWVQCICIFCVAAALTLGITGCTQWMNLPECATVAEYGPGRNADEGVVTHERYNDIWRECRVPKYLP